MQRTKPPEKLEALRMYRTLVEQNARAIPILAMGVHDDIALVALSEYSDDPMKALLVLLEKIESDQLPRPDWVLFSAEAYTTSVESLGVVESMKAGELRELAEIGMPGIDETISVQFAHYDGENWALSQRFKRFDDGRVVWEPPRRLNFPQGPANEALRAMVHLP